MLDCIKCACCYENIDGAWHGRIFYMPLEQYYLCFHQKSSTNFHSLFFFVVVSFQQFNNMDPQQQFCLKWNSYSSNLAITFSNLFKSDLLADVTLYCGGKSFVHKNNCFFRPHSRWSLNSILIHLRCNFLSSCFSVLHQTNRHAVQGTQTYIGSVFEEFRWFVRNDTAEPIMCHHLGANVGW